MSRISRYVFKEILGPTLLGLLVYGLVLIMNLLLEAAELLIRRDLPLMLVAQFIVLAIPRILVLVIPMAVLLGVLVGIGRLTADSEITALRACGYSDRNLVAPVLLMGLLGTLASGLMFNVAVPAANYAQHQLQARIFLSADINREIQPRVFYERIPNMLIYADAASPADGVLQRVLLYQKSATGQEELSSAGTAYMRQQAVRGEIEFHLARIVSHSWQSGQPELYQITTSDDQVIDRPPDDSMQELIRSLSAPPPRSLQDQTIPELLTSLADLRARHTNNSIRRQISEALVELHKKIALPVTALVFAILGLPLSLGHRRTGGRTWGFVVSLIVIVLSYAMLTAGEQLADRSVIPAWFGIWIGDAFFLLIGLVMLATGWRIDLTLPAQSIRQWWRGRKPEGGAHAAPAHDHAHTPGEHPPAEPIPSPGARRFPSTIDRYLLRHLFELSLFVALSMVVLFTLFYAIELIDDLTRGDKPIGFLFSYLVYLEPQIVFSYVTPISMCIGTLITFALLARTHELTAIRAGGIGLFRVATPFVAAAAGMAIISFAAYDAVLPYTNQKANQIRDQINNRSPRSYRRHEGQWVFGSQGLLFNFSDYNKNKQEFQDLAVFRFQPGTFDIVERLYAPQATWQGGAWNLKNGWSRRFDGGSESFEQFADRNAPDIDPPDYFAQDWKAPDQMNYRELNRHVLDLEQRGYDTRDLRVGLYRKIALPCVPIVMVLIGLPFALRVERRGPIFALGVSIVLVFVYFAVLQAFGKMGEVAMLPPSMAAWGPNLLFSALGLYLTANTRW